MLALALDPAADTGGAAWPLPPHAREVLLRVAPAPPAALAELSLVVELNVTYARAGEVDTLCCGWAELPLGEALAPGAAALAAQALPLSGGNALHPRPLPAAPGGQPTLTVSLAPVAPALEAAAARLPADVLAPAAFAPFLVAHRQLCATTRTVANTKHDEDLRMIGGAAAVALASFAALCEAPDTLWLLQRVWTARTEQATPRPGTAAPTLAEQATLFEEALAFAPLLAKSSTVPPFDGTAADHAAERERLLATYESKAHDPFAMMVDDDPSVSYAPLRVHDFDLESVLPP